MNRSDNQPLLRVERLNAWYNESHVLHGIDFHVRQGEVVTLLGRNGAGKSTTLRSLIGIQKKRTGSVTFQGRETISLPARSIARMGIGYCPEDRGIFASLSVLENLTLPPRWHEGGENIEDLFKLFSNLWERRTSPGDKLSGGEQQMLAIARILRTGASLLLLDEPTEGLAPAIVERIANVIVRLKGKGYTVILVEQNLEFANALADCHYVVDQGRIVDKVMREDLPSEYEKLNRYLAV